MPAPLGLLAQDVVGQLETLERWVEFTQGNKVRDRAMAAVVPAAAVAQIAETRPRAPAPS